MGDNHRAGLTRYQSMFKETFGLGPVAAISAVVFIFLVISFAVFWFFHSAPPTTVTMTSGPEGSIFQMNAEKYKKILAQNGINLKILPSAGSLENLKRLADPRFRADIGFVQGGETNGLNISGLVSLGSLYNTPMMIFYRSADRFDLLSDFDGNRLAIGPEGSGTRILALALLAANGIKPGGYTSMLPWEGNKAVQALIDGDADAVFLMGESASVQNIKRLIFAPGVRIFNFQQADGYTHRIFYLNKMVLPMGTVDFGTNIPVHDVQLVGPTVELIARKSLHPAITDVFLEAAREIHGRAGIFQRQGEFPAPQQLEFPISTEALRFYKSGKSFLYRSLPFRWASLVNRILVVFVPLVVVLVPGLKVIPLVYRGRTMLRFYRWYRVLMLLEHELMGPLTPRDKEKMLERLDNLEKAVTRTKVPASFADQFYGLRGDISFVRGRILSEIKPATS